MKHLFKIPSLSLVVFMIGLFITTPVLAIPALPSSFYGTVKVNDANVPDGTVIQALIGGQVYAEGFTQTYQGGSVYALDVRGDDTDTAKQDGGRESDTVQFKIGGVVADQTGVWHTGVNVNLNLTASSSEAISTPQATPSPIPTQTSIILIQPSLTPTVISQVSSTPTVLIEFSPTVTNLTRPSPTSINHVQPSPTSVALIQPSLTPTAIGQASSTPAILIQPTKIATKPSQPLPMSSLQIQPSLTPAEVENDKDNGLNNFVREAVILIALVVVIIIGYVFLVLRKKKM